MILANHTEPITASFELRGHTYVIRFRMDQAERLTELVGAWQQANSILLDLVQYHEVCTAIRRAVFLERKRLGMLSKA